MFRVSVLDVGQGDAILIQTPDRFQILIDGGPDGTVLREIGQSLLPWDRTIDMVVLTHPDADHSAGLVDVFDRYQIHTLVGPGHPGTTDIAQAFWQSAINEPNMQWYGIADPPITFRTPDGVQVDIMHPRVVGIDPIETNDNSLAVKITYRDISFLFLGDMSTMVEDTLARIYPQFVDVTVLKVSHHGSRFSSSSYFLRRVSPQLALISVGCNNTYGHPAPRMVQRLQTIGIPYYDTCTFGRIKVSVDSTGQVSVRTQR